MLIGKGLDRRVSLFPDWPTSVERFSRYRRWLLLRRHRKFRREGDRWVFSKSIRRFNLIHQRKPIISIAWNYSSTSDKYRRNIFRPVCGRVENGIDIFNFKILQQSRNEQRVQSTGDCGRRCIGRDGKQSLTNIEKFPCVEIRRATRNREKFRESYRSSQ